MSVSSPAAVAVVFVVRLVVVIGIARIATLGAVAPALVALVLLVMVVVVVAVALVIVVAVSAAAAADAAAGAAIQRPARQRHRGLGECPAIEGPGGPDSRGDGRAGEDGAVEVRGRHRHRLRDPPGHVAGVTAAGHHDREARSGEGAGPTGADLEQPGVRRGSAERPRGVRER